jgi:signal transduction histidine kinase
VVVRAEHEDNGRWRISVADNGIGIAEQHRDQIFSMFRRLHSSEEYAGMGVGLAVCRRVVDLHGGQLTVDSTVGEGSTFTFTLPAGDEASPVQDKQEAHA